MSCWRGRNSRAVGMVSFLLKVFGCVMLSFGAIVMIDVDFGHSARNSVLTPSSKVECSKDSEYTCMSVLPSFPSRICDVGRLHGGVASVGLPGLRGVECDYEDDVSL